MTEGQCDPLWWTLRSFMLTSSSARTYISEFVKVHGGEFTHQLNVLSNLLNLKLHLCTSSDSDKKNLDYDEYMQMSVKELRAICKDLNINNYSKKTKTILYN